MRIFIIRHRIKITLIFALALILATPFVPFLVAALPWTIVGFAVFAALMAWMVRERFDTGLALCIGATFLGARLLFPNPDSATITLRAASLTSYFLLHVVLLIGPWSRFVPKIRDWYKHRRHLGVTTFLLALLHAAIVLQFYFGLDLLQAWQSTFIFFGSVALLVMAILAATSWDWWQKHVTWKAWTVVHGLFFLLFLGELWVVNRIWRETGDVASWTLPALAFMVIFWIIVAPWGFAPRMFKVVNGWKQLHVLIYVAYASVVIHLYFGAAEAQGLWAQATTLGLVAVVLGSHAAGWIKNWMEKKRFAIAETRSHGTSLASDVPWHDVTALADLTEGKGKRVDIHGLPIALFLHQGKTLAYFGFCAHQKGPLWEGKIIQGYLTCPWHGWQYSVTEGKGPPGFEDRVPMYETKVENGRVFVKMEKAKTCENYSCAGCRCKE